MTMTKQLIESLRKAADWIKYEKVDYNWGNVENCNCGILAQAALNLSHKDIKLTQACWSEEVKKCSQTGINYNKIVDSLLELGMTPKDFINLEFLVSDGKEPEQWWHDDQNSDYRNPDYVVIYMRNWADRLENKLIN